MATRKNTLWRVPAYCILAGWLCFELVVFFLGKLTFVTLPDGSMSNDPTRWLVMSGILFLITVLLGGLLFFSKMTRREVFCSASIMVAFHAVATLISYHAQGRFAMLGIYHSMISEWSSFVTQLLYQLHMKQWAITVIACIIPYVFIPFGKKTIANQAQV